ncbi:TonB family protein [Telmatospirillum siberiense]|uniref:TonB C-terminal domain-containing protein n=1 Tax=Telmatospirillum siberiense TaxID=382514 RepID=A0A2N3PPX4_9PROT|nr:TonB family protein [Telmatospirillum siberiense]PKU22450.1 hypothetical protein CWS72_21865 [Telmatospirillum siberiense]
MRRRFTLWQGLVASILIHAGFVLPFVVTLPLLQPKKSHTLVVELQGMISNRQVEQKKAMEQQQPQPMSPPPVERREVPKPEEKKVVKRERPARPVAEKPVAEPLPLPPVPNAGDVSQAQQMQQTVRPADNSEDAFKGYLRDLKRKLQNNLIYPDTAKLSGLRGIAVIGFAVMEDGDIREESLRIIKSSGFPELDRNALATARSSAPFERPPKEITVAVAVAFEVKN